jgi:hypothetical protein
MTELFLWGSYGVTFVALGLEVAFLMRRAKKSKDLK